MSIDSRPRISEGAFPLNIIWVEMSRYNREESLDGFPTQKLINVQKGFIVNLQSIEQATILDIEVQFALENNVWFNATKMVKSFNEKNGTTKRLDNFWTNPETIEYIAELEEELQNPKIQGNMEFGGSGVVLKQIAGFGATKGTYIHPELGILLARYLSTKFARACQVYVWGICFLSPTMIQY